MKIETEQVLLGQEPDMPGLSLLLDEQALLDVVQLQLPAADISRIRIDYLRYKPGTGCLAGLRVFDVLGRSQHAFARVLPRDSTAWPYQSRRLLKRTPATAASRRMFCLPGTCCWPAPFMTGASRRWRACCTIPTCSPAIIRCRTTSAPGQRPTVRQAFCRMPPPPCTTAACSVRCCATSPNGDW